MKRNAFTLIEVMVVLSIIAIIAILAYNFFGNSMKDAKLSQEVTKRFNDLTTLCNARDMHVAKFGEDLTFAGGAGHTELVDDGILKTKLEDSSYYWHPDTRDTGGPSTANDPGWYIYDSSFKGDICNEFNNRYCESCGAAAWYINDHGTLYPQDEKAFCYGITGPDGSTRLFMTCEYK